MISSLDSYFIFNPLMRGCSIRRAENDEAVLFRLCPTSIQKEDITDRDLWSFCVSSSVNFIVDDCFGSCATLWELTFD
jgi:hypothetical protein